MNVVDRFMKYVRFDTMSDPNSESVPSSAKQLVLAQALVEEMQEMGIEDAHVDEYGIVYGWIPSNTKKDVPAIGLIAHMDTSPDMSGENVKPRIIRQYNGGEIVLNEALHISMSPKEFESLNDHVGKDLIVSDGTTLLGADDKAGIAEILTFAEMLIQQQLEHGLICIAFTPDEEVGHGADHFDIKKFKADYAYTVDGGSVDCIDYENFNAASALVEIHGKSIHPGSAKNKMLNALQVGMEFDSLLPKFEDPACTEGYEGFHHLHDMAGACEYTRMEYIIRNHDEEIFARQKEDFLHAAAYLNQKYGEGTIVCTITDSYANMRQIIEQDLSIVETIKDCMRELGLEPKSEAIRGGTDGARLTYDGLPCPNLGTGGYNYHGKYEYACINEMEVSVALLLKLVAHSIRS